ncbi:MAG: NAD(P)/FAD-dependent oxidoreductase [Chloroflexi bacterium]|nr:NAD(P)/FAD-dependent oxidoreductase [Chloroflexota bacterium]
MGTPNEQVTAWLAAFGGALERCDVDAAAACFQDESYWRDLVAFTWNITTVEHRAGVAAMVAARAGDARATAWQLDGDATESHGLVEAWLTFETAVGRGIGHVRLRDGRCWTLLTTLQALTGFEEQQGPTRPLGVELGGVKGRVTWQQRRAREQAALGTSTQPYVLIVGGGQGGLGLGARLRRLGVPALIVDRNARPGDSWRNRYDSLTLHDTVWFDHMPYIPFPAHWPVYTPKEQMGDWLEMYAKVMELHYWGSTECKHASYDEAAATWSVTVDRAGDTVVLQPAQLVLATGMSGLPNFPALPGAERFTGDLYHSSAYRSGAPYRGKQCVVLGANNSAHDICQDLWEHDAAVVTMVQRSPTTVVRGGMGGGNSNYSESALARGITTERADLIAASTPYRIAPAAAIEATRRMVEANADFYASLEAVGFKLDQGEDGSGVGMKYQRRGSGYYIDVGASALVASGAIALRSGVGIERLEPRSVVLTDGSELHADLVVLATGYGPMNGWTAKLISPEVADRVGKVWGLGSDTAYDPGPWEGELRNMWKPTQQPGLWFHGGNLAQSRYYSRYLALQLKARYEGISTPVYALPEVHHRM